MELNHIELELFEKLLAEHGITCYEIFLESPEGSMPPESPLKGVRKWSGYIVRPDHISSFWLDWFEGRYTLGHEDGYWEEDEDDFGSKEQEEHLKKIQHFLQKR